MTPDWDANLYHRISEPQFAFGLKFLQTLELAGTESVIDAGCGTGRLTAELLERLPQGHGVALDRSEAMLAKAMQELGPRFGPRVAFVAADLLALPESLTATADLLFSTATFHWVLDHDRLFAEVLRTLKPGGHLRAQCGGAGNLERVHAHARTVMGTEPFAEHFRGFREATNFADVTSSMARLVRAGFTDVNVFLTPAPSPLEDRPAAREFLRAVVLRHHLAQLPAPLQGAFLEATVDGMEGDGAFLLDYVRLNLHAQRPA